MGSRDRTYRPGLFSTPRAALGAWAQSIRDSLSYDTLSKVESLHVKVLTRPMPLDIEMADSILNGPQLRADAEEAVIAAAEARAASTSGEATTAESAELDAAVEDMFETYGGEAKRPGQKSSPHDKKSAPWRQ